MHYLVYVIVDELSEDEVKDAMAPHEEEHWDWYRVGGRWDGHFQPKGVAAARESDNGFNFSDRCEQIENNHLETRHFAWGTDEKTPYVFVEGGKWTAKDSYQASISEQEIKDHPFGRFVEDPDFKSKFAEALDRHPNGWIVVVDVHN